MGAFVEMSMDYFRRRNPLFTPQRGFGYEDERARRQVGKQIIYGTVRAQFEFHSHQAELGRGTWSPGVSLQREAS